MKRVPNCHVLLIPNSIEKARTWKEFFSRLLLPKKIWRSGLTYRDLLAVFVNNTFDESGPEAASARLAARLPVLHFPSKKSHDNFRLLHFIQSTVGYFATFLYVEKYYDLINVFSTFASFHAKKRGHFFSSSGKRQNNALWYKLFYSPCGTRVSVARCHSRGRLFPYIAEVIEDDLFGGVVLANGPGHHVAPSARSRAMRNGDLWPDKGHFILADVLAPTNAARVQFFARAHH